jgi:hypothetical protein
MNNGEDLQRAGTGSTGNVQVQVEEFVRQYCILPDLAYLPLSLWIIATYLPQCFDCFPYMAFVSPLKQCGKTRALEVSEALSNQPWLGTTPTPAALFRMMENTPTLLLDEVEALAAKNASETQQSLLAILNAGHRRGATVPRCAGKNNDVVQFPVYGPKAFAGIGNLPGTLDDRCIRVQMQRKERDQKVQRWLRPRVITAAAPICASLMKFAAQNEEVVSKEYAAAIDSDLDSLRLSDRELDVWLPLFAVCAVVAPDRNEEVRQCAEFFHDSKQVGDTDDSLSIRLLSDLREHWPDGCTWWETSAILRTLLSLQESPWREQGSQLSCYSLATMLRPFGVQSAKRRIGEKAGVHAYSRAALEVCWGRYLKAPHSPRG